MNTTNRCNHINELITVYLTEKERLDSSQLEELNRWIHASPENKKYIEDLREIWFAGLYHNDRNRFDNKQAYRRFLSRTGAVKVVATNTEKKLPLRPWMYAAAVTVLLLIVSYTSYRQGSKTLKNKFAEMVIEAPLGSRTKMYLPDGTLVWLNAGSKIVYSQGFGVNERSVKLAGEGYFEVVKNEKLPFTVYTNELHVDVTGTKFNFRSYPEDEEVSVCLLEGKVRVGSLMKTDGKKDLLPDQKVYLNKKTGELRVINVNAQYSAEWTNGYLFFDEELLTDIIRELERSYHVKFTLTDGSLRNLRFYGHFVRGENKIEDILDILASTDKIKYRIEGENIELSLK
jgi:ferric-dicitrate binding protein FerR (iron transport regulator)